MSTGSVPSRMELSESVQSYVSQNVLYKASLIPLDFQSKAVESEDGEGSTTVVEERVNAKLSLQEAALKHAGKAGTVAFVVRRPG